MGAPKPHRCPRCKSTQLIVHEDHIETGATDPGEVFIVDGQIKPPGDFWFNAGDPSYVGFQCAWCDHEWRSRWSVGYFPQEG